MSRDDAPTGKIRRPSLRVLGREEIRRLMDERRRKRRLRRNLLLALAAVVLYVAAAYVTYRQRGGR